ncbi:MAG TPA: GTPase HflX [Epulopiscium sp.]|nr:GTPase HflX [Candidatus Epulonipiscium sp.]
MINGNISGIRNSILKELEQLYDIVIPSYTVINQEIIDPLCILTQYLGREISVGVDRKGKIISVTVGDSNTASIPHGNDHPNRLCGIRIIHTHPSGNPALSLPDVTALMNLKLDCMVAIGVTDGKFSGISLGFCDLKENNLSYQIAGPMSLQKAESFAYEDYIKTVQNKLLSMETSGNNLEKEKAILVSCDNAEMLDELEELALACDVAVVGKVLQKRKQADVAFYVGKGKAQEIALQRQITQANVLIFDDELSGTQIRNLMNITGCKVIDRTTLILEIFANRARTREAKLQIELAQLNYRTTRPIPSGSEERAGGGIGSKGPGEKKLEIDRRNIMHRIEALQQELQKLKTVRKTQRERRITSSTPNVALVGYTNVGKSTIRNHLAKTHSSKSHHTKEGVLAKNMLFATLETTTRAITLADGRTITLTDTIGFIRKLSHNLVEAFQSTLEEVKESDLLLHVIDASSESVIKELQAVEKVLIEIEANEIPSILVFNKMDGVTEESRQNIEEILLRSSTLDYSNTIWISAKKDINLDNLLELVASLLPTTLKKATYLIPYAEQGMVAYLHRNALISNETHQELGTLITAEVNEETWNKMKSFLQ